MSYYYSWNNKDAVALTMGGVELFIQNCKSGEAATNRQALLEVLRDFKSIWSASSSTGKRERGEEDQYDLLDRDLKRLNSMISMVKATDNDQDKLASLSNDVMAVNKRWQAMMTSHIPALPAPVREPSPPRVQDRLMIQAPEYLEKVQAKGVVVFDDRFVSALVNACLNESKAFAVKELVIKLSCLHEHYKEMAKRDGCKVIKTDQELRRGPLYYWNSVNLFDNRKRGTPYKINVVNLLQELQYEGKYDPDAKLPNKLMV